MNERGDSMKRLVKFSGIGLMIGVLLGCSAKNETNLTQRDLKFIQGLGILEESEDIELFESNGGFDGMKKTGNFITSSRIAHYWIDDDEREINSAFFHSDIDSITQTDLVTKLTYASYLTVYKKDGRHFNVYVDADSTRTYQFFNKALDNWVKYRRAQ